MKEIKTLAFVILFYLLSYAAIFAQTDRSAEDGFADPDGNGISGFTKTDFDSGITKVMIDSSEVLILTPNIDTLMFNKPNGWTLSGIKWQYDNSGYTSSDAGYIARAMDVDDVTDVFPNADSNVYLITDFLSNRVIVRHVGTTEPPFNPFIKDQYGPVDAELFEESGSKVVLVTYRTSETIIKFDYDLQREIWRYGGFGVLSSPSDAEKIKVDGSNEILIADTGYRRVIIVNAQTNAIVWEYTGPDGTFSPVDVESINDPVIGEHVLITDQAGHRVLLVRRSDESITWQFGTGIAGSSPSELRLPSDADWLEETGRIVIADKGNSRILEVSRNDSTHYYQWPNSVNEIEDVDARPDGSFLICEKVNQNNKEVWLPTLLAFSPPADKAGPLPSNDSTITDILTGDEREVDFRQIFLRAQNPPGTTVDYQFRSAPLNVDIDVNDDWLGPNGINTKYVYTDSTIVDLYSGHKPHTSCQFGAHLSTTDIRITPRVDSVGVIYYYYNVIKPPQLLPQIALHPDSTIGPAADAPVSVAWDSLVLYWKPSNIDQRFLSDLKFRITFRYPENQNIIYRDPEKRTPANGPQKIMLSGIQQLIGVKRLTFSIEFETQNSGLTPQLDGWKFYWREFENGPPSIHFADSTFSPKPFYTATGYLPEEDDSIFVDQVYLRLSNVLEPTDSISVTIRAPHTNDAVVNTLVYKPANLFYGSADGTSIILLTDPNATANPSDSTLELFDRDSLFVEFQSLQRPGEILADTIMVVQGTIGDVFIENTLHQVVTEAYVQDALHIRVTNEMDRNLDPVRQDVIQVRLQNDMTSDTEDATLYEQGENEVYNSGIFLTEDDILLSPNSNSGPDDGMLYSRPGDRISARYADNFKKQATFRFLTIPPDTIEIETFEELVCQVAPNPYRENSINANFRMRIKSDLGAATIEKIKVFNFAGEKVLELAGDEIAFSNFGGNTTVISRYGYIDNWWNLLTDSGLQVASGTYWVKVEATVQNETLNQTLSATTKFVVVR